MTVSMTLLIVSCQKDPLDEVNSGIWNKERNIVDVSFRGQIGDITNYREGDSATISFTCNTAEITDLSKVEITSLELSVGATASVTKGDYLNFNNNDNTAKITVTAAYGGKSLDWTIKLVPFNEELVGTWKISGLYVYGGTGAAYGGSSLVEMRSKSWCWNSKTGPAAEMDNTLTFALTGVTDEGNSYGTIKNDAGSDGLYADFIFVNKTPNVNVNSFYRKIPTGTGTWERNYSAGTVTFTFADGITATTGGFISASSETVYGTFVKTVTDHSFKFTLKGADDWASIYSDYDRFVSNPRYYWIDISKQ